jgi:hypothetical protein
MEIQIVIVDAAGTRVVASSKQLLPDGNGRPRCWEFNPDHRGIRSLTATEQWAMSFLLLAMACQHLMVDPNYAPALAAVHAYQQALRGVEADQRDRKRLGIEERALKIKQDRSTTRMWDHDHSSVAVNNVDGGVMFMHRSPPAITNEEPKAKPEDDKEND